MHFVIDTHNIFPTHTHTLHSGPFYRTPLSLYILQTNCYYILYHCVDLKAKREKWSDELDGYYGDVAVSLLEVGLILFGLHRV